MRSIDNFLLFMAISGWVMCGVTALIMELIARRTAKAQLALISSLESALGSELRRSDALRSMVDSHHKPPAQSVDYTVQLSEKSFRKYPVIITGSGKIEPRS